MDLDGRISAYRFLIRDWERCYISKRSTIYQTMPSPVPRTVNVPQGQFVLIEYSSARRPPRGK
jgi:hypothetical protein